ncbi:MAG: Asp-tRNA(Asn)/Glu-tRNA(Gln) amidotransferase subunit GatA [Planctomycetota bacterium]
MSRSARSIAAAVNAGTTAIDEVTNAIERARADTTGAVIRVDADSALDEARSVDERIAAGQTLPLAGVPVLIKDNICCRERTTTACSHILEGFVSPYDATAVERLRVAGAVIIGATNMDEFAMGSSCETSCYGPTRNPAAPERVAGGSSGGSAAAVAAGIAPLALGSDTGGSIRQPAAFCGTCGLKPTYGRVSRYGLIAFGSSLDQIGPLSRDPADAALCLAAIAGVDPRDSSSVPQALDLAPIAPADGVASLRGLRVGVLPSHREGVAPAIAGRLAQACATLRDAGAELVEIALPHERYAVACYYVIATGEAASNLSRYDGVHYGPRSESAATLDELYSRTRDERFGTEVKRRILTGTYVLSAGYFDAYYLQAQRVRHLLCRDYASAFSQCDVILGPTAPAPAFRLGEKLDDPLQMYLSDVFTIGANLAGIPALSLPWGTDADGLPIGLHLQAPQFAEDRLLRTADGLIAMAS